MFITQHLTTVDDVIKLWPRLNDLAHRERVDKRIDDAAILQMVLLCIQNGCVVVLRQGGSVVGFGCAELMDEGDLYLRCVPPDEGKGIARECVSAILKWASERGIAQIRCVTYRLNGSTHRYFQKTLGFKLESVTFKRKTI